MARIKPPRSIVLREIHRLISMALSPDIDIGIADRYVMLARKYSMRYKVRIPRSLKIYICKKCKRIIRPGLTGIYRIKDEPRKHLYIKCLRCGGVKRIFFD